MKQKLIILQILIVFLTLLHSIQAYSVISTSRSCKNDCIDKNLVFCPTVDMKIGYCCLKTESCPNNFGNCSSNFTQTAMKYFMCPQESYCGSSYIVTASSTAQSMGVNTNQFADNSICHYVFKPPSSASAGDAIFLKMESIYLATATVNQSPDFVNFGTQYTLNTGQYVTIYLPNVILLTIKADSTVSGYFYLSYQYYSKANLNKLDSTIYANGVSQQTTVSESTDWVLIYIIVASSLIFILIIVNVVLFITFMRARQKKVRSVDIEKEYQNMLRLYEKEEAEKEKIMDSKDTNYQKETSKDRKSDENNENDLLMNDDKTGIKRSASLQANNKPQDWDERPSSSNKFFNLPPQAMSQTAYNSNNNELRNRSVNAKLQIPKLNLNHESLRLQQQESEYQQQNVKYSKNKYKNKVTHEENEGDLSPQQMQMMYRTTNQFLPKEQVEIINQQSQSIISKKKRKKSNRQRKIKDDKND